MKNYIIILIGILVLLGVIITFTILTNTQSQPGPQPTYSPKTCKNELLNPNTDCKDCLNNLFDPKSDCKSCLNKDLKYPDCKDCSLSPLLDPNDCSVCQNQELDPKTGCLKCKNDLLNPDEGCKVCKNTDLTPISNCTVCKNPLYDPKTGCKSCLNSLYNPSDCKKCNNPLYDPSDCQSCQDKSFTFPNCNSCSNQLFDPNNSCQSCFNPKQDFSKQCTTCLNTKFKYPDCKDCIDIHYEGDNCDICKKEYSCGINECCVDPDTSCWGGTCCPKANQGIDSKGNKVCCKHDLCGSFCCQNTSGQVCDTSDPDPSKHTCKVGCPDITNPDLYKCAGQIPSSFPSNKTICNDNQKCVHDCDTNTYKCVEDVCQWNDTPVYTPVFLLDNDNKEYIYKGKPVVQCTPTTGNTCNQTKDSPLFIQNKPPSGSELCAKVDIQAGLHNSQCNVDKCIDKISSASVDTINWNFNKENTQMTDNGLCTGYIGCDKALLLEEDTKAICDTLGGRCCKATDGSYTGQVCTPGTICDNGICKEAKYIWDASKYRCVLGEGTPDNPAYSSIDDCGSQNGCIHTNCSDPTGENCPCCGNWTHDSCALTNNYKMSGNTIPNYFDDIFQVISDLKQNHKFLTWTNCLVFVPSNCVVKTSAADGSEPPFTLLESNIQSKIKELKFNVYWAQPPSYTESLSNWTFQIEDPNPNAQYWANYNLKLSDKVYFVADWQGNNYIDVNDKMPDQWGSPSDTDYDKVNACATIGKFGDNYGRPGCIFLNFPIPKSTETSLASTKSSVSNKSYLFVIVLILLILLLFFLLRK